MQAAGIEDLFQHVILGPLQAHARGWCFGVTRIDVEQDATASALEPRTRW